MTPLVALTYSFLFGLLHGVLPDEHTWPITFSYAVGGASGKEGMRAALYFSGAFTVQRMLLSELAYLALAPFLLEPTINGMVYMVVGIAMSAAGWIVLRRNHVPHFHPFGPHKRQVHKIESKGHHLTEGSEDLSQPVTAPAPSWTIVHGFIAGFGFGGFSLFVNTVAAPAMPYPWSGFLPGLLFGLGTMIMLVALGALFGASLRWTHSLTREEIKRIGAHTGGRTLFFGGLLFSLFGVATVLGLGRYLPFDAGYLFIGLFMVSIALPSFAYSWREVRGMRKECPNF